MKKHGLTIDLLKESFPIDEKLSIETVRKNILAVAKKINDLLEEEKQIHANLFSKADLQAFKNESTTVGLDGEYLNHVLTSHQNYYQNLYKNQLFKK